MYRRTNSAIDGEGLQADVMRFMAIIAFCLVAIMALVRDVTPPVAQTPVAAAPRPKVPVPEEAEVRVAKVEVAEVQVAEITVEQAPVPEPKAVQPKPLTVVQTQPQPQPEPQPEPQPPAAQASVDEPGLSLRFGTDKDFLRLIARGDVSVYLFDANSTYRLSKNYAFSKAPAPGQIYELMSSTIPSAIKRAAENSVANSEGYRWGVVMPERIASRIQTLVQTERSGQLVINRFGEVRHQPNPALAGG